MTDGLSPAVEQGRGVGQDVLRRHGDGAAGLVPRARLLRAAVGFALVPPNEPELRVLHQWLDSWRGVGDADHHLTRFAPRGGPQRPGAARAVTARSRAAWGTSACP